MPQPATVATVALLCTLLVAAPLPVQGHTLKVATYNIWNVMFNWDVRKYHIADMIRSADVDVVALQEVRADEDSKGRNQLQELKDLLPGYRWHIYQPVQKVVPHPGAPRGWEMEGLGMLSRHPLTPAGVQTLSHQSPKDKNQRQVLHATLSLGPTDSSSSGSSGGVVNVSLSAVHLSYDRWQQCVNVAEIMKHIRASRPAHSVILGDFNTYADYPWPLEGLLLGYFSTGNKCPKYAAQKNPTAQADLVSYRDAWTQVNPNKNGFTFSNMPVPGFESRPDRVLFSSTSWQVLSCRSLGLGTDYAARYSARVMWARWAAVLEAAAQRAGDAEVTGAEVLGCRHDCGPHGTCRCGVCVASDKWPHRDRCTACSGCDSGVYRRYLLWRALAVALALQSAVSTWLWLRRRWRWWWWWSSSRSRPLPSLRPRCCPELDGCCPPSVPGASPLLPSPKHQWWTLAWRRRLPSCPLPCLLQPRLQLALCCAGFALLGLAAPRLFADSWRVVRAVLPEELNPSDHLMVVAVAQLKPS